MRHLILSVFGFSTLFAGVCTMPDAQAMELRKVPTVICHFMEHEGSVATCNPDTKTAASLTQDPCPDGSCIIEGVTGERIHSGVKTAQQAASHLPVFFPLPLPDTHQGRLNIGTAVGPAPPDMEQSEVLRL